MLTSLRVLLADDHKAMLERVKTLLDPQVRPCRRRRRGEALADAAKQRSVGRHLHARAQWHRCCEADQDFGSRVVREGLS